MIVRKLRLRHGWSQDQLAELTGVTVRTIQRIERGHRPSLETAKALGAVFEVDFSTFTSEDGMSEKEALREEEIEAMTYAKEVKDFLTGAVSTYFVLAACLFIAYGFDKPMLYVVFGVVGVALIFQGLIGFEAIRLPFQRMERRLAEKKLGRKL
ncbi:MAG: helix-turn-helix domain-containing protein [Gammaproteobacteria bacterium]|jgi:transcriptional regulator with XRE-family HTH domain|nr:helix-turn-helix domain-containing protein [Gammaproteobacteria bacterium]